MARNISACAADGTPTTPPLGKVTVTSLRCWKGPSYASGNAVSSTPASVFSLSSSSGSGVLTSVSLTLFLLHFVKVPQQLVFLIPCGQLLQRGVTDTHARRTGSHGVDRWVYAAVLVHLPQHGIGVRLPPFEDLLGHQHTVDEVLHLSVAVGVFLDLPEYLTGDLPLTGLGGLRQRDTQSLQRRGDLVRAVDVLAPVGLRVASFGFRLARVRGTQTAGVPPITQDGTSLQGVTRLSYSLIKLIELHIGLNHSSALVTQPFGQQRVSRRVGDARRMERVNMLPSLR